METPIFIPFTKESNLRKKLQEIDKIIGEATGSWRGVGVNNCELPRKEQSLAKGMAM